MAFSQSPQFQTYKAVPIPFNGVEQFRSGDITTTRDLQIKNMYYDRVSNENQKRTVALKKRPGLKATAYSLNKVTATDPVRGSFYDAVQNAFYWVVLNKCYRIKPDVSTTATLIATLNTSTGYVGFCSFLKSTGVRYVCFSDGTDLWINDYVAVTCVRVTDLDFPTPHQPYPVYLDGYILLVKSSTSGLYSSEVDDPFAWDPNDVIDAEINSDYGIRPIKVKNYMAVMGYRSIEYFYDAANASGSPLSRNDSAYRAVGYVAGGCSLGDTTYFVGQDNAQNLAVYSVNSFKVERISNSVVDSTLQAFSSTDNTKGQITLSADGYSVSVDGHNFYVLPTTQTTWVYDVDEKFWYEWKDATDTAFDLEATWSMYNGAQYCAIAGQSFISILSPAVYQDFGTNFECEYTTDNWSAETINWKVGNRLTIICDQYTNTGTSNLTVSWSDNDWAAASTIDRTINVFSDSPNLYRLGRFRTRSWRVTYADNYPLRMTAMIADINVGAH